MTLRQFVRIVLSAFLLLLAGCTPEPGLDKAKFGELDKACQELKTLINAGRACEVPDALLQRLDSGVAAVTGRTASRPEADLLAAYANLAVVARDGLLVCRSRTHLARFEFVPKGRIYVTQDLDPVVERYGLVTESHIYQPTGARWKSISSDSPGMVWDRASALIRNIEVMLKYS